MLAAIPSAKMAGAEADTIAERTKATTLTTEMQKYSA
jgi:hypothetical protein